jgi:hypothetical protein
MPKGARRQISQSQMRLLGDNEATEPRSEIDSNILQPCHQSDRWRSRLTKVVAQLFAAEVSIVSPHPITWMDDVIVYFIRLVLLMPWIFLTPHLPHLLQHEAHSLMLLILISMFEPLLPHLGMFDSAARFVLHFSKFIVIVWLALNLVLLSLGSPIPTIGQGMPH